MRKILLLILISTIAILTACKSQASSSESELNTKPTEASETGYPISDDYSLGYPVSDYPIGPVFTIDTPVKAEATTVTGTGPSGVPIILVDATEVGKLLGETIIKADGTFQFELSQGLPAKHQIGLQLGDLTGTDLNANDYVYSDSYYVRPLIGIMFDMIVVDD